MKLLQMLLIMVTLSTSLVAANKEVITIDNLFEISFAAPPEKIEQGKSKVYALNENYGSQMVTIINDVAYKNRGNEAFLNSLYDGYVSSVTSKSVETPEVTYLYLGDIKAVKVVIYAHLFSQDYLNQMEMITFYYNGKFYSLTSILKDKSKESIKERDSFFNSITFLKKIKFEEQLQ